MAPPRRTAAVPGSVDVRRTPAVRDTAGRATLTWTIRFQVASFEKTEQAVQKQATVLDRDDTPARWRWREWH